jgi:transglutaminase-like putative cysteine protease
VAAATHYETADEQFVAHLDHVRLKAMTIAADHDGLLHRLDNVRPGKLIVDYQATIHGEAPSMNSTEFERSKYARPSRYCESDQLGPFARTKFGGLRGRELLDPVSSWVGVNIAYIPGSSRPTDGAVETLTAREGVCRDFAHLTTALLRANDLPARIAAVYAPGLNPINFHAVTEAYVDGIWHVVDPTCLAPRQSMVRIATGANAADIAFLTNIGGTIELTGMSITAVISRLLAIDDVAVLAWPQAELG